MTTYTMRASLWDTRISCRGVRGAASVVPYVAIDWDTYANTAALLADNTRFNGDRFLTDAGGSAVSLTTAEAYTGHTKSMQYKYNHPAPGDNTITLTNDFLFATVQQDVWLQCYVKYSTNFTTANAAAAPNDHKLIFGLPGTNGGANGAFRLYIGSDSPPTHNLMQQHIDPSNGGEYFNANTGPEVTAESIWTSGTWHTIRLHMRCSTTSNAGDGTWVINIDGRTLHSQVRSFSCSSPDLRGISLGRNKDDGPPAEDMFLWWGPVTVYNTDPGWGY